MSAKPHHPDRKGGPPATRRAVAALQRLAEAFAKRRAELARGAGLTVEQWRALEQVAGDGGMLPSLFARSRDCSAAAVSRTLRQLTEAGLVEVECAAGDDGAEETDGRRRRYRATAAGRARLAAVEATRLAAVDALWGDLPPAEVTAFADFGERMAGRLEGYSGGEINVSTDAVVPVAA